MTDELLDLVNKNDEVVGEVWKNEAHQNNQKLHREVAVIIYDKSKKILFQKRSLKKKVNPGVWAESAAGHVPKGMKPIDAAHKELLEELGFDTKLTFFTKTLAKMPNEHHFTYWFVGKCSDEKIKVQKNEVEQVRFMSQEELRLLVKQGAKYNPIKYGGYSRDVVNEFWKCLKNQTFSATR